MDTAAPNILHTDSKNLYTSLETKETDFIQAVNK